MFNPKPDVREIHALSPWHGLISIDNCIIVGGHAFDIGVRVVKWWEPAGFDAYKTNRSVSSFEDRKTGKPKIIRGRRYRKRRGGLKSIKQIMIHHTGGDGFTAHNVYETLHNHRGLSVPFIIDDDGTIYQTLDAALCAYHGGKHNNISIGFEGMLYPLASINPDYYSPRRNARNHNKPHVVVTDTIHGRTNKYFQFTAVQRDCMAKLAAGCWVALAILVPDFELCPPEFARVNGNIPRTVIPNPLGHRGLIGHLQATRRKIDPAGFEWESFEEAVEDYFWDMARGWA